MNFFEQTRVFTFGNGVRLGVMKRPGVSFQLLCGFATGSIHEEEHLGSGLSHIMEHMLFQGCGGYPGTRVSELARRWSASLNAYTSFDRTVVTLGGPAPVWSDGLAMVLAMVRSPEVAPKALAGELEVILRECAMYDDKPSSRLFRLTMANLFRRHPLRHPVIGYPELIRGVTAGMLLDYHRRRYTPDRCVIAVAGAVDPEAVRDRVGELLSGWERSRLADPAIPDEAPPAAPRVEEALFADPLARIGLAFRIPGVADPEAAAAAEVMLGVLGMGRSSLLIRRLERELGIAVGASAVTLQLAGCGAGMLSASGIPGKLDRLEGALRRTVEEFRRDGVTAEAVRREKRQRVVEAVEQMEAIPQAAAGILDTMLLGEDPAFADRTLDAFQKTGVEAVRDAARRFLDPEHFAAVRLRPAPRTHRRLSGGAAPGDARLLDGAAGLRCSFERRREFPLIRFAMALPGGTIEERDSEAGVSSLLAAAFAGGTRKRGEETLLAALDGCGAALDCSAGANTVIVSLCAPRAGFARAFALLLEMLSEPAWNSDVIEREKSRLAEELRTQLESPLNAARIAGQRELFGSHPYRRGGEEVLRNLKKLDRGAVGDFFRRQLLRERAVFGFCGDLTEREARRYLGSLSSRIGWFDGAGAPPPPPPDFPAGPRSVELQLDREQAIAMRLLPGVALGCEHPPMSDILLRLENGLASEFGRRMREENHLAYQSGFTPMGGAHPGSFTFYAATAPEMLERAAKVIDDECERLGTAGVGGDEFSDARDGAVFAQRKRNENPAEALFCRVLSLFYGGNASAESAADEIAAIGRDEFNRWLAERFRRWRDSVSVTLRPARPGVGAGSGGERREG